MTILDIDVSAIENAGLKGIVATLQAEWKKNPALAAEILGEKAAKTIALVEKNAPNAIKKAASNKEQLAKVAAASPNVIVASGFLPKEKTHDAPKKAKSSSEFVPKEKTPDAPTQKAESLSNLAKKAKSSMIDDKQKAKKEAFAYKGVSGEIYTLEESFNLYNAHLSDDEIDAYQIANPSDTIWAFRKPKKTAQQLFAAGLLFRHNGQWAYRYSYLAGDVSAKLRALDLDENDQDAQFLKDNFGQSGYESQLSALSAARPMNKKLISADADSRIVLHPFSEMCKTFMLNEFAPTAKVALNVSMSVKNAFVFWLNHSMHSESRGDIEKVISIYVEANPPRISKSDKLSLDKDQEDFFKSQMRSNAFEIGQNKFLDFLELAVIPENRKAMEAAWNEQFNGYVMPDYAKIPVSVRHSKKFKKDSRLMLADAQRNGVAFFKENGSACLGYDVGVGKTLTAIACISDAFDQGRANVALMVVPDATYKKWSYEIAGGISKSGAMQGAVPHINLFMFGNLNDDIVYNEVKEYTDSEKKAIQTVRQSISEATEDLLKTSLRKKLANLIADTGRVRHIPEKSIILINYHGATRLGIKPETSEKVVPQILKILSQGSFKDEATAISEMLGNAVGAKAAKAHAEKEKQAEDFLGKNLESKIFLEDLGIDFLCMDEAHNAKKVFTTVKGTVESDGKNGKSQYAISSGSPSQLAVQIFTISLVVQSILAKKQGQNVLMLTATPFTNSPLEVFSMLALSNYKRLVDAKQASLTEFFNTYIVEEPTIVVDTNGNAQIKPTITGFNNLAQLKSIMFSIIDYKTGEDAGVIRPGKLTFGMDVVLSDNGSYKKISNGNAIVKMGLIQQDYNRTIQLYTEDESESALDLCKSLTANMVPCSLTSKYIAALERLEEIRAEKGIDHLPELEGVRILRGLSWSRANALSPYLFGCNDEPCPNYLDFVEESPKIKYACEAIRSVKEYHESRNEAVSGQIIYASIGVQYFFLIKQYLVKNVGFAEHEVEIIASEVYSTHDKKTALSAAKKEAIKEGFLKGDVKVIIGSSTIKEGIDLQTRSTVLYILTPDWNPTEYTQVEGRLYRQGNIHRYVRIVNVMAADSADIFMLQKREEKTRRIKQLLDRSDKTSQLSTDEFDASEIKLALIKNPAKKAKMAVAIKKKDLSGKLSREQMKLRKLQDLDFSAVEKFAGSTKRLVAKAQFLNDLVNDFKDWQLKEEDSEAKAKYEATYGNKIAKGEKPPYESKYAPEKVEKRVLNTERLASEVSTLLRIANRNSDWQGFSDFDTDAFGYEYSNWQALRTSSENTLEILKSMGLSVEQASTAIEVQEIIVQKLFREIGDLEDSVPQLIAQYKLDNEQEESTRKTWADQLAIFASLNHYMDEKVMPEKEAVLEVSEDTTTKAQQYQAIIDGFGLLLEMSENDKKKASYQSVIDGFALLLEML